jgi:hypothetical protein
MAGAVAFIDLAYATLGLAGVGQLRNGGLLRSSLALWTVSFPAAAPDSAATSVAGAAPFLVGVGLGTLTWYGGFSTAVALTRKRV